MRLRQIAWMMVVFVNFACSDASERGEGPLQELLEEEPEAASGEDTESESESVSRVTPPTDSPIEVEEEEPPLEFEEAVEASGADQEGVPGQGTVPGFLEEAEEEGTEGTGGALVIPASDLDGLFLYGLSAEMGTPLTQVGNTVAGIVTQVVQLDLEEMRLAVRVFDVQSGGPVGGEQGVVEAYPLEWVDDDQVRISFEKPTVNLEIQLYQSCTYGQVGYGLLQEPLWKDGMMTWGAIETYESSQCWQGGLESSTGLNVHFLRRFGANESYIPKEKEDGAPFGFFQVDSLSGNKQVITRLPGATLADGDGGVTYYITEAFPEKFRAAAKGVFQDWNDVFEEEVGIRPFTLEDAPPEMIPWDPRYRTLAWNTEQTLGAVAPFLEDPVTGEMFSTYVLFWLADFQSMVDSYEQYVETNPDAPWTDFDTAENAWTLPPTWFRADGLERRVMKRRTMPLRRLNMAEIQRFKSRAAQPLEGEDLENFIIADFLSHELGHNLGLRHNFHGSADHENHEDSPSSSVMDYILGMGMPGLYDRQAIRYAYGDGNWSGDFMFCTDENVDVDPGCVPYDLGNPVEYLLGVMDRIAGNYPLDFSTNDLENISQMEEWNTLFLRLRRLVNTYYETLGPSEEPVSTLNEWMARIQCGEECETHSWIRAEWSLYLLYTQHYVGNGGGGGGWEALPLYSEDQESFLFGSYYDLVTNPEVPLLLRYTIADKLGTTNLTGAPGLVNDLISFFEGDEVADEDQGTLLDALYSGQD